MMWDQIKIYIMFLKPLRVILLSITVIMIFYPADPLMDFDTTGWKMVTSLMPVFAPMVFLVLLLDALMARVMMSEHQVEGRKKYRFIITLNLLMALLMAAVWFPFFAAIMGGGS